MLIVRLVIGSKIHNELHMNIFRYLIPEYEWIERCGEHRSRVLPFLYENPRDGLRMLLLPVLWVRSRNELTNSQLFTVFSKA